MKVQKRLCLHCKPLMKTLFKPIIQDNYYNDQHHFMFELDRVQAANLISKFSSCVLAQYTRTELGDQISSLNMI
uniref:DCD domain-containing protein n=1 Tax=Solanum tuberosum TaxID=4113 RepID=M1CLX0_SOLTU